MQLREDLKSHDFGRTCRLVGTNASEALAAPFSSIGEALFAAVEMASRADEPCLMCGVGPEEPARWARGTQPLPISEPAPQIVEMCEPDMIFTTSATQLQRAMPDMAPAQKNMIVAAMGAILMAIGALYIYASLGIRR